MYGNGRERSFKMSETNKALDKQVTTKFLLKFSLPTIIGTLIQLLLVRLS